ncbi:MAG: outer membrane lipoprotein-sorting protein [Flavobacteriales bacterium]|nr:MAG: outer membrane lipoprotein-sorting protein [Flavobacteriales bacterium]
MKSIITVIIAATLVVFTPTKAQTPEEKGLNISKKAELADNGWGNYSSTSVMTLKNRNGQTTTRKTHGYFMEVEGDGDKSLTIFDTPKDVKGTASMTFTHKVGDDDQWLYLPSIKRVKRISSSNKSGPFMGSEFAFEDLSSQEVEKYKHKYIGLVKLNGVVCYKLERYPIAKTSGYKKVIAYLNKENYRPEKVIFYDRKDSKLKTLTYSSYKKYAGKYWRANQMKMVNHQNGKETLLNFSNMKFNDETITEETYTQNSLKRAK